MKIICQSSELCEACANVQRAVSAKSSIPSIEGILINALNDEVIITGYDLEVGITTSVRSNVKQGGKIILNAKILCDILRRLPGETVTIETDERLLATVRSGDAEYSLIGIDGNEFPELPTVSGGFPIVIERKLIKNMVKQTIFSVADANESKPVYKGIKFEIESRKMRLIAVDGFRLAMRTEAIDYDGEEVSFIVPSKTLSEVVRLIGEDGGTISFGVGKRHIVIEVDGYTIVSRLLEGEFLNYKGAIPVGCSTTVRVNVRELIDCIERISLIITDKLKTPVRLNFADGVVKATSITALGTANDKVNCKFEGNKLEVGMNNKFLLDALRASDSDEIRIEMNGAVSPVVLLPVEGDSFLFLVLPVRIKNDV